MGFSFDKLFSLRPYLYRVTSAANVPHILSEERLVQAADLFRAAGR